MTYIASAFEQVYDAPLIRTKYENFEALNSDVCKTQSIKGIINHNLAEPQTSYTGLAFKYLKNLVVREVTPKDQMNYDVQFFYDNDYTDINNISNILS